MTEEIALLQEYARTGSQPAFASFAQRYVNLVYSAARRQVYGDEHDAEDVTQAVFQLLAQRAKSVPVDRPLSGWLLKVTGYCAANARRARGRRENHERRAASMAASIKSSGSEGGSEWDELSPLLDQGLGKLPAADRDALVLRFMEQKTMRQVGEAMGISEEAAQKRVMRAVEKLRDFFQRRGVATMSAAALATLLTAKSVQAAPASLATSVASASGTSAAAGSSATLAKGALIIMATEKVKVAAIAAVLLILGIGGGVVAWHTLTSSGRRRVVIDPVAASTATAAPTGAVSKWPMKFSDGTILDLLALNDPNVDTSAWWAADGSVAGDPNFRSNGSITMNYLLGHRIDLIVRMRGNALGTKSLTVRSGMWGAHDTATLATGTQTNRLIKVITVVGTNKTTNLRFGFDTGKWPNELNLSCANNEMPPIGSTGAGARFNNITEEKGQMVVHLTMLPEAREDDQQVVVVTGGKETPSIAMWSNLLEDTYVFRCPRSAATRIIVRSRPFEWMEMKNVAVTPIPMPTPVQVAPVKVETTLPAVSALPR